MPVIDARYLSPYGFSLGPATIVQGPADRTASVGESVQFEVQMDGTPPLEVQWYRNGEPLAGANSTRLTLSSISPLDDEARFTVKVSNSFSETNSRAAILSVRGSQPRVTLALDNLETVVSWPVESLGFTLQVSTNLLEPVFWTTVQGSPDTN